MDDILICEISGKRPGTKKERPTERFRIDLPHVIISNNADGYETEWDVVMVPDDYREWYVANIKNSENAWYAQMNRSYAIKYAKDHGYRYCVQLDDNINMLAVSYSVVQERNEKLEILREYRRYSKREDGISWIDDLSKMLVSVLKHSNAGMAGMNLCGVATPSDQMFSERYCYSFFCVDTERCAPVFHGDFEDDIEFRLKLGQMGVPVIQVCPLGYSKVGQLSSGDETGCRAEYTRVGINRGGHMSKLYGDIYSCKMGPVRKSTNGKKRVAFKHMLKISS